MTDAVNTLDGDFGKSFQIVPTLIFFSKLYSYSSGLRHDLPNRLEPMKKAGP